MSLKRMINYGVVLIALIMICPGQPAFSQTPTTDCQGTIRAWQADVSLRQYMSTHNCYCPSPNSTPVCTPKSTTRGAGTPPMGGYGSSEAFAAQMMGSLFGSMLQSIFAPPQQDTSYQQQLMQQQMEEQKRQEAIKRQAMERWKKLQREEESRMAEEEARKRERGRQLLAKMEGTGGGRLEPFRLETPRLEAKPIGTGIFDTSGYTSWQRLLCSAYFSSKALAAARGGNPEGAVFMNIQADRVTAGEMTDVDCQLPGLQQLADMQRQNLKENNRIAQMVKLIPALQEKIRRLQQIEMKLTEARKERAEAETKLKETDNKVAEAKVQAESALTPEEKSEADDLLAQALALQDEASAQVEKANDEERKFAGLREKEIEGLEGIQEKINTGSGNR